MPRAASEHKLCRVVCAQQGCKPPPSPRGLPGQAFYSWECDSSGCGSDSSFCIGSWPGLFSREGSPGLCSASPCFLVLGGPPKKQTPPLRHGLGYLSRTASSESAFVLPFSAWDHADFGFSSEGAAGLRAGTWQCILHFSVPLILLPGLLSLMLFDNVFFPHLASQLTSKPYHI